MNARTEPPHGARPRLGYHDLQYPWNIEVGPFGAEVEAATRAWVVERGLLAPDQLASRYDPLNIGLLASLSYPRASRERLLAITAFLTWIFIQDDYYDSPVASLNLQRLERNVEAYDRIMNGDMIDTERSHVLAALGEIVERFAALTTPAWMRRFARSMHEFWTNGILEEMKIRVQGVAPAPDVYMRLRLYSIGVLPVLDLVEFSQCFTLPDHVVEHPSMQRLWRLTARIIIYTNDILSYHKERKANDPNNFVHVLMQHEDLSLVDAVNHMVLLHDEALREFNELTAALPDWPPELAPLVQSYLDGHRAWMRGALEWQIIARRYATGRDFLEVSS